jgi:predicted Rossmann-fold nucleotide-binding protein
MLKHCVDEKFMKESHSALWHVAHTPEETIDILNSIDPKTEQNIESKY